MTAPHVSPEPTWLEDHDDWAKEDCSCGHPRYAHERGRGKCNRTRTMKYTPANLPEPIFADDADPFDPFREPINWPPYEQWPEHEVPCCAEFYPAELARMEAGPNE